MNAEHSWETSGFLRTVLWTILFSCAYFVLGTLLYDVSLGIALLVWFLFLGPIFLLPAVVWQYLKLFRSLKILDLRSPNHSTLAQYYFEALLKKSGPRPIFYSYRAKDLSFFWWEKLWSGQSTQIVLVPQSWLKETPEYKRQDFESLWSLVASSTPAQRKVRTGQMYLWASFFLPLEVLTYFAQKGLNFLGFSDLPPLGFWMFRSLKNFQGLWFSLNDDSDPLAGEMRRTRLIIPKAWQSICFGVWSVQPRRFMHPFSRVMIQNDMALSEASR